MKRFLIFFLLLYYESIFFPHCIETEDIFSVLLVSVVTNTICMICEDIFYSTFILFTKGGVGFFIFLFVALNCIFGSAIFSLALCEELIRGFEINGTLPFCVLVIQTSFLYFLSNIRIERNDGDE